MEVIRSERRAVGGLGWRPSWLPTRRGRPSPQSSSGEDNTKWVGGVAEEVGGASSVKVGWVVGGRRTDSATRLRARNDDDRTACGVGAVGQI